MEYQHELLEERLKPARTKGISSARLAEFSDYHISFVRWEPGTGYEDHSHLDTEWIYVVSGDLVDGERSFGPKTLLTYPPGSQHDRLRTVDGTEFLLIWTGHGRVAPIQEHGGATDFQYGPLTLKRTTRHRMLSGELARIDEYAVQYLGWDPGLVFQDDHVHQDMEWIFVISGDIADGDGEFKAGTLLTYPPGSKHDRLRTVSGAELLLVWTGPSRVASPGSASGATP